MKGKQIWLCQNGLAPLVLKLAWCVVKCDCSKITRTTLHHPQGGNCRALLCPQRPRQSGTVGGGLNLHHIMLIRKAVLSHPCFWLFCSPPSLYPSFPFLPIALLQPAQAFRFSFIFKLARPPLITTTGAWHWWRESLLMTSPALVLWPLPWWL